MTDRMQSKQDDISRSSHLSARLADFVKQHIIPIGISILFLVVMIASLSSKAGLHVDEAYSYGLSNNVAVPGTIVAQIEDGATYPGSQTPFEAYMTVQYGQRLEYPAVWLNQEYDVHPPLYYVLLHTVCSFFPNTFSIWFAGGINIVFALLTLVSLRKLCFRLLPSTKAVNWISLLFVLSAGTLMNVLFLRMYVMVMWEITTMAWLFVKTFDAVSTNAKKRFWLYPALGLLACMGALTHYYTVLFTVPACIAFGLFLLFKKKWTDILALCLSMAAAAGMAWMIFPTMIDHVFHSYRGEEAMENMQTAGFSAKCLAFLKLISDEIFGGFFWMILLTLAAIVLISWFRKKKTPRSVSADPGLASTTVWKWLILAIPAAVYFLVVVKVAPYQEDRYVFAIYPLIAALVLYPLLVWLQTDFKKDASLISLLAVVILTAGSWMNTSWKYRYIDSKPQIEYARLHADKDLLVLGEESWKTAGDYMDLRKYRNVSFVPADQPDLLKRVLENHPNFAAIKAPNWMSKEDLQAILKQYGIPGRPEKIGSHQYMTTWALNAQD